MLASPAGSVSAAKIPSRTVAEGSSERLNLPGALRI